MEHLKFKINVSFWVFLAVAVVLKQGYTAAMYSVAMVLHETAHYVVAKRLFYRCNEIQISVFGAVLYGDFQDVARQDRIKIALAGPLCNFALCLVCLSCWWIVPESYFFTESFFTANLTMGCTNLLPCYPLDGGRVLTGILDRFSANALHLTKVFTYVFSALLFGVFVLSLFTAQKLFGLGLFATFLFSGAFTKSGGECYVKSAVWQNKRLFLKRGMEKKTLVFDGNCLLRDVAKRMQGNFLYCLEVVDDDMNVLASYNMSQLERIVVEQALDTKLKNLGKTNLR